MRDGAGSVYPTDEFKFDQVKKKKNRIMKLQALTILAGISNGIGFTPGLPANRGFSGIKPIHHTVLAPQRMNRYPAMRTPITSSERLHSIQSKMIDSVDHDRPYTFLCHGSGQDDQTPNTVIGDLQKLFELDENMKEVDDYVAIPGPGAGKPMVGTYAYNDLEKTPCPKTTKETFGFLSRLPFTTKLADLITGASCTQGAATATSACLNRYFTEEASDEPTLAGTLNLIGYSRGGAVTAVQILNNLKALFGEFDHDDTKETATAIVNHVEQQLEKFAMTPNKSDIAIILDELQEFLVMLLASRKKNMPIKVNMFLIDPVAGVKAGLDPKNAIMTDKPNDCVTLNSLVVCYSMHDRKKSYTPQYPERLFINKDTKAYSYLMPGRHKTVGVRDSTLKDPGARRKIRDDQETWIKEPALINTALIIRFLAANNVDLTDAIEKIKKTSTDDSLYSDLSIEGLEKRYNSMMNNLTLYELLSQGKGSKADTAIEFIKAIGKLENRQLPSDIKSSISDIIRDSSVSSQPDDMEKGP